MQKPETQVDSATIRKNKWPSATTIDNSPYVFGKMFNFAQADLGQRNAVFAEMLSPMDNLSDYDSAFDDDCNHKKQDLRVPQWYNPNIKPQEILVTESSGTDEEGHNFNINYEKWEARGNNAAER